MNLQESTYGVASYESIPHTIKPLNEEIFNKFGDNFHFRDGIKSCMGQEHQNYKNYIMLSPDHSEWYAYLTYDPINQILYNFEVNPKYRGMGIGKYIMKKFPIKYLYVLKNNDKAIGLYKKCGFKHIPGINVYSNFDNSPDNVLMYNKKIVPTLFRKGEDGNVYSNISVPKSLHLVFTKAFNHDVSNNKILRETPFFRYIKNSNNPSMFFANTYKKQSLPLMQNKKIYVIMSDVDTKTPLTLNYNNLLQTKKGRFVLHENKIFNVSNNKNNFNLNINKKNIKNKINQYKNKAIGYKNQLVKKYKNFTNKPNPNQKINNSFSNQIKTVLLATKKNEIYHFNKNLKPYIEKQLSKKYKFDKVTMKKILNIYKNINVAAKSLDYLDRIKSKASRLSKNKQAMMDFLYKLNNGFKKKMDIYSKQIKLLKNQNTNKLKNKRSNHGKK